MKQSYVIPALVVIFLIFCLPGYILFQKPDVPSVAWHEALEWVKDNTPADSLVVSWWDYGYWIKYLGQRKPYIHPGQETESVQQIAKWLLDGQVPEGVGQNVYLIIDERMLGDFIPAMRVWDGGKGSIYPFVKWLNNLDGGNAYYITDDHFVSSAQYHRVFSADGITIFGYSASSIETV